jgi:hypothetical protein
MRRAGDERGGIAGEGNKEGSMTVTPGKQFAPNETVDLAKLNALGAPTIALGNLDVLDAMIASLNWSKILSGVLSGTKVLQMSGAGVILRSAGYTRDNQTYTDGVFNSLSHTLASITANFTVADVGRAITSDYFPNGTTIASVTDAQHVELSNFPTALVIGATFRITGRPRGTGFALYGDGTMEVNEGAFRGTVQLPGFNVATDGTVTIGSGPTKMVALPNGDFIFGMGGAIVGITHDGKLFAGGADYASAVFVVEPAGNVIVKNTAQSLHSINIGAIDATMAAPVITPAGGAFDTAVDVSINCATQGAKIYYTVDGTTPDKTKTLYAGPVHLTTGVTLKAIAYKLGEYSAVTSVAFTTSATVVSNPEFAPIAGDYSPTDGNLTVELSDITPGSSIRYTTDGSTPSSSVGTLISPANSTTGPIGTFVLTTGTRTVKAIAFKAALTDSDVVTAIYNITNGGNSGGGGGGGWGGGGRNEP